MPCVSLAHRKIYRETVARQVEARRLLRSTEKSAAKSAKKAAHLQAIQKKTAIKTVKKLSKETSKKTRKSTHSQQALQYPLQPQPQSPLQPQNQSLSTLHSKLVATSRSSAQTQASRPLVSYISSTMQEFYEGIEVKILHTKHRLSVDNPLAEASQLDFSVASVGQRIVSENVRKGGSYSSPELFATNEERTKRVSPVTTGRDEAGSEENTNRPMGMFFRHRPTRAELINAESSLGRTLFGPIPAGHRREFFHDHENVWIWHEDWLEPNQESRQVTIRYEVRPTGVYKKLSAGSYVTLEGNELENFRRAAHAYLQLIKHKLYHLA